MASTLNVCPIQGICSVNLSFAGHDMKNVQLMVIDHLCTDIIVGHDILGQYDSIVMKFAGNMPSLNIDETHNISCALKVAKIEAPPLFSNLYPNVHPVACSSRKFSEPEYAIINKSVTEMLECGTIRPSVSPWRAQVLVVGMDKPKPRMVVDYSRTINKFTMLDAYPLPNLDDQVRKISRYSVYSTYDLKSAYHQVPIQESEKHYTAFEALGKLYEFNVIPFGVMNGVAAFQRVIDMLIEKEGLEGTFAYLDNITIGGDNQEDHDKKDADFLKMAKKYGLTLNDARTVSSVKSLNLMGYLISKDSIQPDPERMRPLLSLPYPEDAAALKRALGLFSYYSRWVDHFSDRIRPLVSNPSFPLNNECKMAFDAIKSKIAGSCIISPDNSEPLVLESDASDFALAATLSQGGKPVAFYSRTLKPHERNHHPVEKEACAIVESCRKWQHYLLSKKFLLITDQQAVSFMFSHQNHGKIKNSKILRWRIELSALDFDIKYRPGPENVSADCLTRSHCAALLFQCVPPQINTNTSYTIVAQNNLCATSPHHQTLEQIHVNLSHPGVVRLNHFVKSKNLPFSLEDIKRVTAQCEACSRIKPRFIRPTNPPLIEATKPFDRISIDFKGPLPSVTNNKYLLTIIDEYSRFPFGYPCPNMESSTVIKCLTDLFSLFGTVGSTHSDNGPSLISSELRNFFLSHGIAYSNSSKYNPKGNGQVERYNGVIWKAIQLNLFSKGLGAEYWEHVLPEVLHSQRSLLCTSTNETPHEWLFAFQRRSASGNWKRFATTGEHLPYQL